ncbi:hypothetical protein HPP92_021937 [Vanilla planifolia]|uniref:Translation elongation factor EFTs/EF1B dimerisation domain-containing protein n=1 Tax=Vanilla planifolia TaxID=51239 RepID=A0A835PZV5_VANPL|nr:hypothetical protein HPP92_021937 [Vanilla planifolia]
MSSFVVSTQGQKHIVLECFTFGKLIIMFHTVVALHYGCCGDQLYRHNMKIDLNHPKLSGESMQSAITEVAAMVGENIAGMLTIEADEGNVSLEALRKLGSSLAMHIVAAKPLFLSREQVSIEAIEAERDILKS